MSDLYKPAQSNYGIHTGDVGRREHDIEEYQRFMTGEATRDFGEVPKESGEGLSTTCDEKTTVKKNHGNSFPCGTLDFDSKHLAEIHKRVMGAIEEHKSQITTEYKNVKRELDIEKGNLKSQLKLAKKEKRSEKTIEQREKVEYGARRAHMIKLHELLMKHHFSLCNVEEGCVQALKDECLTYTHSANKMELSLWRRICRDCHETLELPIRGFTVQKKWKRISDTITELLQIIEDGIGRLNKFYQNSGIKSELHMGKEITWKATYYLREVANKLNNTSELKKKALVVQWYMLGEQLKESLGKHTLQIRYDHQHRLESMVEYCNSQLNAVQERSARRHGKLMQKIAKEQQLLDKDRMEMKRRQHRFNKKKSEGSLDQLTDSRPPIRMPTGMGNTGNPYGGAGLYGRGMGAGGGMQNYNMSNAVDSNMHDAEMKSVIQTNPSMPCSRPFPHSSNTPIYRDGSLLSTHVGQNTAAVDAPGKTAASPFPPSPILEPSYLSSSQVVDLGQIDKLEMLEKYFQSEKVAWMTNDFDFEHHTLEDTSRANANENAVVKLEKLKKSDVNRNVNAGSSTGSYDESSSESVKAKKKSDKGGNSQDKGGSFASKLFGFGKKKSPAPSSSSGSGSDSSGSSDGSSGSDDSSSSSSGSSSGDSSSSKSAVRQPSQGTVQKARSLAAEANTDASDIDYIEFEPNEHKDKWSRQQLCKHCNMDKIVDRLCPCLKEQYQDFKERRREKKHKKAMRKNVLLRLRDEASRSRNA